jgi:hypothetical protein
VSKSRKKNMFLPDNMSLSYNPLWTNPETDRECEYGAETQKFITEYKLRETHTKTHGETNSPYRVFSEQLKEIMKPNGSPPSSLKDENDSYHSSSHPHKPFP